MIPPRITAPIILVTGSTDGIGKATAKVLGAMGSEVIVHGRDEEKGRAVQREVNRNTSGASPDLSIADFSDQEGIRRMASDLSSRYPRLDVLVNNAGTYQTIRHLTRNGLERTFAVNYLAPFLLTHLLLPLLRKNAAARIVTVVSSAHEDVERIDWGNILGELRYDAWGAYGAYALSKFADITFTYMLARNLEGTGTTANCLHPGVTNTRLLRAASPGLFGISSEEGARTSVYLAVSPGVAGVTGRYFEDRKSVRFSALTYDRGVQERLWQMAETLTGITGL